VSAQKRRRRGEEEEKSTTREQQKDIMLLEIKKTNLQSKSFGRPAFSLCCSSGETVDI
jgi:hypothetical protein